ncbi:phosphoribosyltransferase [Hespellia stercorisuis]|uniref:Orotate phosphoribosyltransferase n=1 Tax=Hespellia stercorisuis DSM 15480 TaxID=1121950 RepID=A0A1M6HRA5_9FIRM|nr:orotate phosphoribosyltransferase [Hespellia stercorisuis]SHJ24721.1 orotate phosphoribosyltransferase [Hespellia stercorisuis DSM 15480]
MEEKLQILRSEKNPKARIKYAAGHFVTTNAHVNTYIDMSTVKCRHNNARETAKVLAVKYLNTPVSTIVCLGDTNVIAAFMAAELSDMHHGYINDGMNISIVTPEFNQLGQIMFRDDKKRLIEGQQVLILTAMLVTGATINKAIDAVLYYGGSVCGISSIFSNVSKVAGLEVNTVFGAADLPNYQVYKPHDCVLCQAGRKVDALVNGFGYSKL